MYTQCPECQIAFRVTAKVLQQAGGNVRCGSCGHAFNALEYLSEEMPEHGGDDAGGEDTGKPVDELAETSRRLLETLDELAGPEEVRIEDTGVEWRVLDEAATADVKLAPDQLDLEPERRYDDNTPLPDEFDDGEHISPPEAPERREEDHEAKSDEFEGRQGDLALSEPEEWADILEEVRDPGIESLEVEEELAAIHNELSAIDEALTDEVPQLDEGEPETAADDVLDDIEADLIEQIEAGAVAELLATDDKESDEADDDLEDNDDTGVFEPVLAEDEHEEEEDEEEAEDTGDDEADDDIDEVEDDAELADDSEVEEVEEEQAAAEEELDFAATMVGLENPEELFDESSGEVETIIMEGDFILNEVEKERIAAEHSARSQFDDPAKLLDTYALNRGKVRGGRRNYDPPSIVIIGAILGLSLILLGQFMHNSRQSLATYGFFNSTIAPVYRMLGSPITPDWDVNGWQFEATNGSVDEGETTLTIVSRIANQSTQLLPYPLIHVSLTNRFEDVMGSAILEPGEYLAGEGDPSQPVEPGEDFTAVITVDDPSVDATGFKLYVCYRVEVGTVRCADHDFKN